MEYTVLKLAQLAGVSSRTLRFYDEIGLLKPAKINSSGYRIYEQKEVDCLQQILFYRELGFSLDKIQEAIHAPNFDKIEALKQHHDQLLEKKEQLEALISNVKKTIAAQEGRVKMSDKEKFEGFKQNLIDENEVKYGKEVRGKYGDNAANSSNEKLKNMSQSDYEEVTRLEKEVMDTLLEAYKSGKPISQVAQKAAELHRQWLTFFWNDYSKEAHMGLVQMYVDDERFRDYYDKHQPGLAKFLRDAIREYTNV
ncbi:MerR family transcriptional regulator [Shimazuella alba]|uniref:MerR family transcriptional regulator n=1 Tax=Shimazuella alba TaxID=2690964 RepID=A0A6I4W2Y6_9BACL|nr:MerR family transcriptional regulator [Shimazuella alba]MXQ55144.1 MerR family transcriptional regulator [Shimazuella alba]